MNLEEVRELNPEDRRRKILELLSEKGRVKVAELSKLFGISEVSVRNDLAELESAGSLERTHGGAVSTAKAYYGMSFDERTTANSEEKRRIALEAVRLIHGTDSLMFNSGTTTLFVARELKGRKDLRVVTNSVPIASEVGFYPNSQVILLGGNYNPEYYFVFGEDAVNQLRKYRVDKLILSVDGVDPDGGITTYLQQESELVREMIGRVNTTVVVADYTKVGRVSFASMAALGDIDILITDSKANPEVLSVIREKGIEVRIV